MSSKIKIWTLLLFVLYGVSGNAQPIAKWASAIAGGDIETNGSVGVDTVSRSVYICGQYKLKPDSFPSLQPSAILGGTVAAVVLVSGGEFARSDGGAHGDLSPQNGGCNDFGQFASLARSITTQ